MPFGPTNVPPFYVAMIKKFKNEWDTLLIMRVETLEKIGKNLLEVTNSKEVLVGKKKIPRVSHTIIDDIILWCSNKELIFIYFICVSDIFKNTGRSSTWINVNFLKSVLNMLGTISCNMKKTHHILYLI